MRDFELEVYFSEWEFVAEHHMTASDAESLSMAELMQSPADRFRIGCGRRNIERGLAAFRGFLDRNHNDLAR